MSLHPPPAQRLAVLRLAAEGLTMTEVGAALHLAPNTIRYYLALLRREVGASNTAHLVAIGFREGWLP